MKFKNLDIQWLGHASFLLKFNNRNGKIIYIDPYNLPEQVEKDTEKADLILITHSHYDHCSVKDIGKIVKEGSIIVGPADIQSKISKLDEKLDLKIIDVGSGLELFNGQVKILGVPSYNINKQFHPKDERWLGYVIKVSTGETIYHAGDTDLIPEIEKLQGKISVALLPVGGTYTMNAEQAAEAASIIKPELAIPMHFGEIVGNSEDAQEFKSISEQKGIKTEILEKNDA